MTKQSKEYQAITFPPIDYETWKNEAEKSLKGKPIEKLHTKTYENIILKPIYTKEDIKHNPFLKEMPGESSKVRGTRLTGYVSQPWHVSQEIDDATLEGFNAALKDGLANGQTMIHFTLQPQNSTEVGLPLHTIEDMKIALDGIPLSSIPVFIDAKTGLLPFLNLVSSYINEQNISSEELTGTIGMDLFAQLVTNGTLPLPLEKGYDQLAESVKWAIEKSSNLRTILVKGDPYHNGGGNAVQELAYSLGTAAEYVSELIERGLAIDEIASRITFTFSIGSNVFMEIAKLRAAKILWSTIIEAYGGKEESSKMYIHARTSAFSKTIYDPYVNMLRSTTEAFSAIIGGIDSLHVSPFDEPIKSSDSFSRRIARNTQSILREESFLDRVIDPAGGSWYVESLTNELAEKAWELFQEVELQGGMLSALKAGSVQTSINKVLSERQKNVNYRKEKIVGTNVYANIKEMQVSSNETRNQLTNNDTQEQMTVDKIPQVRISESFEKLRKASEYHLQSTGERPKIGLLNLGTIPEHKPRADFISGFFEAGGFQVVRDDGYQAIEAAIAGAKAMKLQTFVFCGKDDRYGELIPAIAKELMLQNPAIRLYIAGQQDEATVAEYKRMGILDFIHIGTDCYGFLESLQKEMGVQDNG
ncbi:methylmalonyl-CoA mutase family protein [Ferdinandcohnia sp. Marseille-Q9671]